MNKNNTVKINKFLIIGIVFLFGLIIYKLIVIGTFKEVDGVNIKKFADARNTVKKTLSASRGTIYDRNGEILAQNVNSYTVIAYLSSSRTENEDNPKHVVDKESTAEALSPIINMSKETILNLLNMEAYQVELGPGGRGISELVKEQIMALNLPGIDFVASTKRYYPYGDFMSYTLGYAKTDDDGNMVGEFGVELKYDDELSGENGYTEYQRDIYGYKMANTPEVTKDPVDGKDVYLTTDVNIQLFLEQAVNTISENPVNWVIISALDAQTGEVLGSATTPSFNPNYRDISSYYDPLVSYAFEPGSTMKVYSFMAAMENGVYNGEELYNSGTIKVEDATIKDWNNYGWGSINYDTGFMASSNVAATLLSEKLGRNKLLDFYKKMEFGTKTKVGLPNEMGGKVNFKYNTEVANAAFGQGILTTPIQHLKALTTLANDGELLQPYIVSKIVNPKTKEVTQKNSRKSLGKVVSTDTINKTKNLMWNVVNGDPRYATGTGYKIEGYDIIGKTGTAQIASTSGGYKTGTYDYIKSFVAIFPKDNPKIILYVATNTLVASSSVVNNATRGVIENISKYLNIYEEVEKANDTLQFKLKSYQNKTTETAVNELQALGINPIVIGDGNKIIKQYPEKNIVVSIKDKVFLLTNSTNFTIPDFTNWSLSDIENYSKLTGIKITTEGYGYVVTQNVIGPIEITTEVKVSLKPKYVEVVEET